MGFSRQGYWSGLPLPSRGDLLDPGVEPTSLMSLALAGRLVITEPSRKPPQLFPAMCPEGAGVPGVETGQQDLLQSGSAATNKVVTQPRGTVTLHVYEVKHSVLQLHPPHFMFSVASCGQVPWCWTEQMFKKSRHHREFYWTFHARSLKGCRGTLAPGRLCMCCVNPSIFACFVFFASFQQSKGFENLVPFKVSTVGTMWLGSTKRRATFHLSNSHFRICFLPQILPWCVHLEGKLQTLLSEFSPVHGPPELTPHPQPQLSPFLPSK